LGNSPQGLITEEYLENAERRLFQSISNLGITAMNTVIRITPVEIKEYRFIAK
jgi:hypothetical protein